MTPSVRRRGATPMTPRMNLHDPSLYINRELSLLAFQRRVLEEAKDPTNPLLERVKFLSIVGSNLDEFFMVRVAGLLNQLESGILETGPDGMTPAQQLEAIHAEFEEILVDAHDPVTVGGTGRTIDWQAAREIAATRPLVLAGGLTPDNVAEAVRIVAPWGVDVASGVERAPGVKDPERVRAFVRAVRAAQRR